MCEDHERVFHGYVGAILKDLKNKYQEHHLASETKRFRWFEFKFDKEDTLW
jgi:hypothetical protein